MPSKKKTTKPKRIVTLHKSLVNTSPQKNFTIGQPVVQSIGGFVEGEKHALHSIHARPNYVPSLDNPSAARRPGAMDAFKLPSRTFTGIVHPTHHAVD